MAEEGLQRIRLKDDFYRDGFYKALIAWLALLFVIILLLGLSLYIALTKPAPVDFAADNEWRILPSVPLDVPYLSQADLLQWVSDTLSRVFTYDFVNYNQQASKNMYFFTNNGWEAFTTILPQYVNSNTMFNAKGFLSAYPAGAPKIIQSGLLNGVYLWRIQMPINLNYSSLQTTSQLQLSAEISVVRISTLNNLHGVAIDTISVTKGVGVMPQINA